MTDTYDEAPPAPPIEEWRNEAPEAFQEVADQSAAILQNYQEHRRIADESRMAGEAFVGSLHQITGNFSHMVAEDPASIDTARALARNAVGTLVGAVPGVEPEQMVEHARAIYTDVERELARVAVNRLAERDEIAAMAMLERVGLLLPEEERAQLDGYIGVMARARNIDDAAMGAMQARTAARAEDSAAFRYLSELADNSGDINFRPGWAQRVIADPTLPPDATAALIDTQMRLMAYGDEPHSDPDLLMQLLDGVSRGEAGVPDVLQYGADGLRLADALTISTYATGGHMPPERRAQLDSLRATLTDAQRTLAAPEYGSAGTAAFTRFIEWLLPQFRQSPDALNPGGDAYLFKQAPALAVYSRFMPTFGDVITGQLSYTAPAERPPLDEIFGRRKE